MVARDLRNTFTEKYVQLQKSGASEEKIADFLKQHSQYCSQHLGHAETAEICCGQGAGLIDDIPAAADIIAEISGSIRIHLEELNNRLAVF